MKKILLATIALTISAFAFTNQYSISFENIIMYKAEMAEIERGCDVQNNQISHRKYYTNYTDRDDDIVDTVSVKYMSQASNSYKNIENVFSYSDSLVIKNDIKCLIYEGAVFASAMKRGKESIITRSRKGSAPKINAVNDRYNLIFDKKIKKIYKMAMRQAQNLTCKFSDKTNEIVCNRGAFIFNIDSQSLKYRGMSLYSNDKFYGYGISTSNSLTR